MKITHYGKVNLSLHVEKRLASGYHIIDTLMQEVEVSDQLVMKKSKSTRILCDTPGVPLDENNLIYRAYSALQERFGIGPVCFELEKQIPMGAGMGGGSSNAAAALKGLNALFDLGLTTVQLQEIGVRIGADVPFFLLGGTCRARGIGEVLTPLTTYRQPILLINDGTHADTKRVYGRGPDRTPSTILQLMKELARGETRLTVHNDLRRPSFELYPALAETFSHVEKTSPDTVQLSGTGATIYAIYKNQKDAEQALDTLGGDSRRVLLTHTRGEDQSG